ncbi:hypothetical protein GGR54DRAFT_155219 [Hypoxylon sp. NC1633]|nr:hypothetical protein GGR54DRAFT_155219 [Hypoxylon sp. NC1633]
MHRNARGYCHHEAIGNSSEREELWLNEFAVDFVRDIARLCHLVCVERIVHVVYICHNGIGVVDDRLERFIDGIYIYAEVPREYLRTKGGDSRGPASAQKADPIESFPYYWGRLDNSSNVGESLQTGCETGNRKTFRTFGGLCQVLEQGREIHWTVIRYGLDRLKLFLQIIYYASISNLIDYVGVYRSQTGFSSCIGSGTCAWIQLSWIRLSLSIDPCVNLHQLANGACVGVAALRGPTYPSSPWSTSSTTSYQPTAQTTYGRCCTPRDLLSVMRMSTAWAHSATPSLY